MSKRTHKRWTPEQLEQCRLLFESGMKAGEIGARFDISGGTVSVMAWQRQWQRKVKLPRAASRRAVAETEAAGTEAVETGSQSDAIAVTARERAFNERLRRTIAEYWRGHGREVELHVEGQGDDLLGIRSKSVNGVPVR